MNDRGQGTGDERFETLRGLAPMWNERDQDRSRRYHEALASIQAELSAETLRAEVAIGEGEKLNVRLSDTRRELQEARELLVEGIGMTDRQWPERVEAFLNRTAFSGKGERP